MPVIPLANPSILSFSPEKRYFFFTSHGGFIVGFYKRLNHVLNITNKCSSAGMITTVIEVSNLVAEDTPQQPQSESAGRFRFRKACFKNGLVLEMMYRELIGYIQCFIIGTK